MTNNHVNGAKIMDIFQNQQSVKGETSVATQMSITVANFPLVQFGRSGSILADVDSCCEDQQCLVKTSDTTRGPFKKHRALDDARKTQSNSSQIAIVDLHVSKTTEYIDEGQRKSDDVPSAIARKFANCLLTDVEYRIPLIEKRGSLTGKQCEMVMETLEELQDDGRFEAHEDLVCNLLEFFTKNKEPDIVASLMIERGVAFYYVDDFRISRKLYKDVIRMGESLQNRNLLQGRAYVQLAITYRREKKFGKAFRCLQQAEGLLSHHEPGEDAAELSYCYGANWLDFYNCNSSAARRRRPEEVLKKRAQSHFVSAIANCARDERPRVQLKKKRYYNIRVAALYLDCGTRAARETCQITNGDIREAKKHLDIVEYQLSDGTRFCTKFQLLTTRSDQYYREGKLSMARETAEEALALAERINMAKETIPLKERIEERVNLLSSPAPDVRFSTISLSDSGWSSEVSSSDELSKRN